MVDLSRMEYLVGKEALDRFREKSVLVCGVGAGNIPMWNQQSPSVRLTWHGTIPWNNQ